MRALMHGASVHGGGVVNRLGAALTKIAADWRESESLRPEIGRRVQSRCPSVLAPNVESAGLVAENGKTLQLQA